MNLFKRCLAVFLAAILLTATAPFLKAQSPDDWAEVMRIPSGTRIQAETKTNPGEKVKGELRSATTGDLTLVDESGAVRVYQRMDIAKIRVRRSDVAPIAGGAVGAAWGGLVAGISDGGGGQKAAAVVTVAAVGWLIGKGIQKGNWKTIYEAAP